MRSYKFRDSLEVVFINLPDKDQEDKTTVYNQNIGNYLSNSKGLEAWSEILYDSKHDLVLHVKEGELSKAQINNILYRTYMS